MASTRVFRWRLCHEGLCVCLSWISLVEWGLPGFLFTGLIASLKDCLAGVSGFKRFRCPSHDSRRRSVTMLQGSHFVTSYSCWFVMTRGYFIPRAYRSCRRWKASVLCSFTCRLYACSCPGIVTLVRLISSLDVDVYHQHILPSQ